MSTGLSLIKWGDISALGSNAGQWSRIKKTIELWLTKGDTELFLQREFCIHFSLLCFAY